MNQRPNIPLLPRRNLPEPQKTLQERIAEKKANLALSGSRDSEENSWGRPDCWAGLTPADQIPSSSASASADPVPPFPDLERMHVDEDDDIEDEDPFEWIDIGRDIVQCSCCGSITKMSYIQQFFADTGHEAPHLCVGSGVFATPSSSLPRHREYMQDVIDSSKK